ncbi:MAG: AmmeMemoRadiSam system radical SAM enzyme [Chloroflexi bacterium]|jgi:pyruvate formate lyase activating enzyme|nr:AmmeMemoRadiSam system radical SAM enzyme [Chloroflexota bacterium]
MHEAMLYDKLTDDRVRCYLCAHHCTISDGKKGICHVRENNGGTLNTLVYGRTIAQNIDPIEKKPFYHFHPGSSSYSIATPGCNFRCDWCQNADISQMPREQDIIMGKEAKPEDIVAAAHNSGCRSIAYTYTEPTVFFEYTLDTSKLAHDAGIANAYVSNGYMTKEMLDIYHPYLDAINIDLKSFSEETYKKYIGAKLQPVLESLKTIKQYEIHLEVTTLIIPTINDDPSELRDLAQFIAQELGIETPWHISRFHPMHKMPDVPPTPPETLLMAREIGEEQGLRFVYLGNISGYNGSNTVCHSCGNLIVERLVYRIQIHGLNDSKCNFCGADLNFVI